VNATEMRTNGANDSNILHWNWGSGSTKISDFYDFLGEFPYAPVEPEIHFNCIEYLKEWIPRQRNIKGCVYNVADEDILNLLIKTKEVSLVVSYDSEWMDKPNHWKFKLLDKYYCMLNVYVFHHHKQTRNWPSPMHHKFLIGEEKATQQLEFEGLQPKIIRNQGSRGLFDLGRLNSSLRWSLIYGSFNMSVTSPESLDSFLVFKENPRLLHVLEKFCTWILRSSFSWQALRLYGIGQMSKYKKANARVISKYNHDEVANIFSELEESFGGSKQIASLDRSQKEKVVSEIDQMFYSKLGIPVCEPLESREHLQDFSFFEEQRRCLLKEIDDDAKKKADLRVPQRTKDLKKEEAKELEEFDRLNNFEKLAQERNAILSKYRRKILGMDIKSN